MYNNLCGIFLACCRVNAIVPFSTSVSSRMTSNNYKTAKTIYDFSANAINGGGLVQLEKYRGKVCLIVNVATKCGLTNVDYTQLVELHKKYVDQGFSVLAFPCNQFLSQEPGTEADIVKFVQGFGVEFDMFEKIDVNGDSAHPLWKWLKEQKGGFLGSASVNSVMASNDYKTAKTIYDFSADAINGGGLVQLEKYRGKVCLIVNVATK
ncbi:unnamed protein product [Notodromas monacha]|uniref:Glutathione peroxidase n=1 Tax=Notodromas monacha TaxID=399045 RepID=A0A7R9GEA3_9CRUS|nr:unnamed protein product [Notodromas monacha]CAG0918051.1 unnamed protein product [Notodromas monacha]